MGFALQEADIDVLEQRVEGWIAGLQLVALAMRSRADYSTFVQQLSGSQRFVFDYMQDEVVERQPQEVQDFLLKTSILARLHAPLCQAVITGSSEQACQQMLLTLEKANLFLIPLDEERRWYRLHSLFRDVLQARLQATAAELVPLLHQRAARWYAQQGDIVEAIEHARAGSDDAFAADLMERSTFKLTATPPSLPIPLTTREQEVFRLLVQGQKNREIADQLVISLPTAKKHVANILSKLGAENRVQALVRAHEYGLL
jgi:LuxR family maltose regulon positive regulatory protein